MIHQSKLHQKRKSANPENHTGGFVKIPQYRNGRLEWDCSMVKTVQVQMRPATFKQQRLISFEVFGRSRGLGPRIGSFSVVRCSTVVARPLRPRKTVGQRSDPLRFPTVASLRRLL